MFVEIKTFDSFLFVENLKIIRGVKSVRLNLFFMNTDHYTISVATALREVSWIFFINQLERIKFSVIFFFSFLFFCDLQYWSPESITRRKTKISFKKSRKCVSNVVTFWLHSTFFCFVFFCAHFVLQEDNADSEKSVAETDNNDAPPLSRRQRMSLTCAITQGRWANCICKSCQLWKKMSVFGWSFVSS